MDLHKTEAVILIVCDGWQLSMADSFKPKLDYSAIFEHTRLKCTGTRLKLLPFSLVMSGYYCRGYGMNVG
jgi:hypothetical protein